MLKEKLIQLKNSALLSLKDFFRLLFQTSAKNQLRINNCQADPSGEIKCSIYFSSYVTLKKFQKKLRRATLGMTTMILAVVIVSLILNLATGPKFITQAATFNFVQTAWNTLTDNTASHSNQTGWTQYSATSTYITASSTIMIATTSASFTHITDADFNTGTPVITQTEVTSNSIKLAESSPSVYYSSGTFESDSIDLGQKSIFTTLGGAGIAVGMDSNYDDTEWEILENFPASPTSRTSLTYTDDYIFGIYGSQFYAFSTSTLSWSTFDPTNPPGASGGGADLAYPGSGDYIYLLRGSATTDLWAYSITCDDWNVASSTCGTPDSNHPTNASSTVTAGASMVSDGGDLLYVTRQFNTTTFWSYSISGDNWTSLANTPQNISIGGSQLAYPGSGDYIYLLRGSLGLAFWTYSISCNAWNVDTSTCGTPDSNNPEDHYSYPSTGADLVYPGSGDYIYSTMAYGNTDVSAYSVSNDTWNMFSYGRTPDTINLGSAMVYPGSGDYIYMLRGYAGNAFWRFSISQANIRANLWEAKTDVPGNTDWGNGMIYDGSEYIYSMRGDSNSFDTYSITCDDWNVASSTCGTPNSKNPTDSSTCWGAGYGSWMVYPGSGDFIYISTGGNTRRLCKYSIPGDNWVLLEDSPENNGFGSAGVYDGSEYIYASHVNQGTFSTYSITCEDWNVASSTCGTPNSFNPTDHTTTFQAGGEFIYDGSNYIYAIHGNNTSDFSAYSISDDSWNVQKDPADLPRDSTSGSSINYPGGDYIYYMSGTSKQFYTYSISNDNWTTINPVNFQGNQITYGSSMVYVDSENGFFVTAGNSPDFYKYTIPLSSAKVQLAANNDNVTWNFVGPDGTASTYFNSIGQSISSTLNGSQYVKYKIFLDTGVSSSTPSIDDISINYSYYPSGQTLTSSAYNTTDEANVMAGVSWVENTSLPSGTYTAIELRASSSAAALAATDWSIHLTSTSTNCSKAIGLVTCTADAIPAGIKDGIGDSWFQYRAYLSSGGDLTPFMGTTTITYVVNAIPEVQSVTASSTSAGIVDFNYQTKDPDGDTGSVTPYEITPSFQYSTDGGSNWNAITTGLSMNATSTKSIATSTWTTYYATWTAKDQIDGTYSSTFQMKVIVDDSEAANNIASSTSSNFEMDVKDPTMGSSPIAVVATTSPATLILDATDDTTLSMRTGITSDLSAISYISFASSTTIDLSSYNPATTTVYVQFKDTYSNESTVQSIASVDTPTSIMVQDIANVQTSPNESRLFIGWEVMTAPVEGFSSYQIYRSTDNSNFSIVKTETTRATNYYVADPVTENQLYYYKVAMEDDIGSVSFFSSTISAMANGIQDYGEGGGGTPADPATISSISASNLTTSGAIITWTTNKLSNSTVGYSISPAVDYTSQQGVASYVTTHSVVLTGLTAGTTYEYKVLSTDVYSNIASTTGNSFATNSGPTIATTTVAITETTNTTAKIYWETDLSASGYVVYASSSPPSGYETGAADLATSRTVTLTGLTTGTQYYFYLKSQGSGGNWAYDYNTVSGTNEYYNFITASDVTAPTFSSISASLIMDDEAAINWITSESATGQIIYGTTSGSLDTYSTLVSAFNINHSIGLEGLSSNTTYYYQAASIDAASNAATSTEQSFTTLETLSQESEVVAREAVAESEGVASAPGGGGILIIDKTDKAPPKISNIQITNIKSSSATVSWSTNEGSNSFVEYGEDTSYGRNFGKYNYILSHSANLNNLLPSTEYNFKVASIDDWGNLARSANQTFTTLSELEAIIEEEQIFADIEALSAGQDSEELLMNTIQKAMNIVSQVANQVSITTLESALFSQYDSLERLARTIPPPLLSGEPRVVVTATTAIVSWRTDKEANSLVAIAQEDAYNANAGQEEKYSQVVGNANARTQTHLVNISDLEPETTYHFQVRSKSPIGPIGRSDDFTFTTTSRNLAISSYAIQKVSTEEAVFKWVTNVEADSGLRYTPYRNNILAVDEARHEDDKSVTLIHEIIVDDFEAGVIYDIELYGKDIKGNETTREISAFSTSEDDLPPILFQVQTDSAISPGSDTKVQTIISWMTNEPSTTRVYYQKGFTDAEELLEKTRLDTNYTKKHVVVITKFEPGTVYRFRVESIDSGGNIALSKNYTILTPRQKETVLQIIMKNVEDVFGWVGEIR